MKKFALLLLISILTAFSLCSCFGGGGGQGDPPKETENLIYNATSELYVIIDPALGSELTSELLSELSGYRTEPVNYAAVDSEVHTHEIVIGNTDRAISKTAMWTGFLEFRPSPLHWWAPTWERNCTFLWMSSI